METGRKRADRGRQIEKGGGGSGSSHSGGGGGTNLLLNTGGFRWPVQRDSVRGAEKDRGTA
jgi:hypothetical protein